MTQVWCELRYGMKGSNITLCRLNDPEVLSVFRQKALEKALRDAQESEGVDEVVHLQDKTELMRLKGLFDLITPTDGDAV